MPNQPEQFEHAHLLSPLGLAMTATAGTAQPYEYAEHLDLLSQELVKLRSREPGWPRRLLVTFPPRHGKSEMCSHWFPSWDLALEPTDKIILTSYEAEFAAHWGRNVRRTVQEHYPIIGARITEDSKAAHRWETTQGGGMVTAGVGGPITGKGGNIVICDDPIKNAEEANSQVIRNNIWEWWVTTFLTRMERDRHGNEPILVLILTRWHEDDLAGRIMLTPEFKFWRHLNLPALAEGDNDPLGRLEGDALWPKKFDGATLESKRAEMGSRAFTALYQQRPSPVEGSAVQRSWWRWYDDAPALDQFDQIIQSWDPTFKAAASSDYVAGGLIGRLGNQFYILDCVHQRLNGPDTLRAIKQMDDQYPQARWCLIEDTASGSMICDILERERGHIVRVKTRGRSKETRLHWGVNSVAAVIERGQVWLPRGRSWAGKLVDEAASFPHGQHDDLIDMLVQGIEHLMPKAWLSENRAERLAKVHNPADYHEAMSMDLHAKVRKRIESIRKPMRRNRREPYSGV